MQSFWRSITRHYVIKHSPELKTDFKCSRSKVEFCHKSQQDLAPQKRQILYIFYVFYVNRLMSNSLEFHVLCPLLSRKKQKNIRFFFIIKFHLRQISSL